MTKRSRRNQGMDIVSETQQNARWLYGYRSKTSVSDKTPAEWSQLMRSLSSQSRSGWIIVLISLASIGFLLIGALIRAAENTGFSFVTVVIGIFIILCWSVLVLYLRKFLTTPTPGAKPRLRRKKAS